MAARRNKTIPQGPLDSVMDSAGRERSMQGRGYEPHRCAAFIERERLQVQAVSVPLPRAPSVGNNEALRPLDSIQLSCALDTSATTGQHDTADSCVLSYQS